MTEAAPGTVPAEDEINGLIQEFVAKEPVVVGYGVAWVLANVGEVVAGHTHLIDASQWSTFTTSLAPIITSAVLGGLAWLTRKYVSPVVKKIDPKL